MKKVEANGIQIWEFPESSNIVTIDNTNEHRNFPEHYTGVKEVF